MFCEVYLLDAPYHIDRPFDYSCAPALARGSIVRVPFGRAGNTRLGVVTKLKETTDTKDGVTVKAVSSVKSPVFTLTDEEGNESEFELLGELTLDDNTYLALIPLDGEEDEYVILKVEVDENGDELLVTIDDDEEFDRVADTFEDTFMGDMDLDSDGE